jgi:hypothetical protein
MRTLCRINTFIYLSLGELHDEFGFNQAQKTAKNLC